MTDPPIITTTAATPQDSPNATLEGGASFKDWENLDFEQLEKSSSSSLLRPPPILGSLKALDDRSYFEGMPVLSEMRRKSDKGSGSQGDSKSADRMQQSTQDGSRKSETTRKPSLKSRKDAPREGEVLNNGKCVSRSGGKGFLMIDGIYPVPYRAIGQTVTRQGPLGRQNASRIW